MSQLLYKIVAREVWTQAEAAGEFAGADIDLGHGFIHLSTGEQTQETADLYFAGKSDLVLVALSCDALGDQVRWEPPLEASDAKTRADQLFPHCYGKVTPDQVVWARSIQQDKNGRHLIELG